MMKKNSKTSYSVFILLFSVGISFFPSITKAQLGGIGNVMGQIGGSLNLQGVGPVALSCAKEAGLLSGLPFGAGGGGGGGGAGAGAGAADPNAAGAGEGGSAPNQNIDPQNAGSFQSVPVSDQIVQGASGVIKDNTTISKIEDEKSSKKERCEDKIARFAVLKVMDKITLSTLEWINSGFEGGLPFWVQNPGQFFGDLAGKEILGFTSEISGDANLFPFGETLRDTIILSFARTAQQNMMNSLNNVLAHGTQAEWEYDFSVGGWAGFTAYVEPNNNIFGSYIESSQTLGRRLEGTKITTAINFQRELEQGLGFLSKRYCAETEHGGTYIPATSIQHTVVGFPEITEINQIPPVVYEYMTACGTDDAYDIDGDGQADEDGLCMGLDEDADIIAKAEEFRGRSSCTNWQTSTPGHQIAQQTTKAVGMSQDQLLLADEINENLGLIFDALINQFISQGLSSFGNNNTQTNSAWAQINGFNPGEQEDAVPFIDAVGGFGATGDGEDFPGFIAIQEEYITRANLLISTYQEKRQKIRDLDYCVPGPNPGWQAPAATAAATYLQNIPMFESMPSETWAGAQYLDPLGLFSGIGQSVETEQFYNNVNLAYSSIIEMLTGVGIMEQNLDPQLISRDQNFFPIMYQAFQEYAWYINTRFINNDDFGDNLRSKAATFFFQLDEIANSITQYQNAINSIAQTLEDLVELREEYALIEHQYIVQYLQSAESQGITNLDGQLGIFEAFGNNPSQITYIGNGNQNSAYHNAVETLNGIIGEPVVPPISDPEYADILEDFLVILQGAATQENIDVINDEIEQATEDIGDPTDDDTIIGLIYSCIYQVNNPGPGSFEGFPGRKAYPFPLSPNIPGLLNLPTTATFLENVPISTNSNHITLSITPTSAVVGAPNVQVLESAFINLGGSLY